MAKSCANHVATAVFAVAFVWASAAYAQLSNRAEQVAQATTLDIAQAVGAMEARPGESALSRQAATNAQAQASALVERGITAEQEANIRLMRLVSPLSQRLGTLEEEALKTAAQASAADARSTVNELTIALMKEEIILLHTRVATLAKVAAALKEANRLGVRVNADRVVNFAEQEVKRALCALNIKLNVVVEEGLQTAGEAREALVTARRAEDSIIRLDQRVDKLDGRPYVSLTGALFNGPLAGVAVGVKFKSVVAEMSADGWWGGTRRLSGLLAIAAGENAYFGGSASTIWLAGFDHHPNDVFVALAGGLRAEANNLFMDFRLRGGASQQGFAADAALGVGWKF